MISKNYKKIAIIDTEVYDKGYTTSEKPYVDFKITTNLNINFSPSRFIFEFTIFDLYNQENDAYLDTKNKKMIMCLVGQLYYEIRTSDIKFDNLKKTLTIVGKINKNNKGVIVLKRIIAIE